MNNDPLTLEKLQELIELVTPKTVHMNIKTYEAILPHLEFEPTNIEINHYIPDNQAIIINEAKMQRMLKENLFRGLGVPKDYF